MGVPGAPHPHRRLVLPVTFHHGVEGGVKWNRAVVLFCISLISNNVEHLFMGSLALPTSSLVQRLLGEDLFNRVLCYY